MRREIGVVIFVTVDIHDFCARGRWGGSTKCGRPSYGLSGGVKGLNNGDKITSVADKENFVEMVCCGSWRSRADC